MNAKYALGENEVLEVKSDILFHDLFNEEEMNTIEWTVMMILDKPYEEIHNNVKVSNIRLTRVSKNEKPKYVDLIVTLKDKKIVIELNNNYCGSYLRNTLYALVAINNSYIRDGDYYNEKIQGILVNLNWYKSKKKADYSKREIIYQYPKDGEEKDYLLKIININLDYYSLKCYNKFKGVDKLSKLLTIKDKRELKEFTKEEKLLEHYYKKMDRLSHEEEYCKMVWDERLDENLRKVDAYNDGKSEGIEIGIEKGIEKGIEQGILQNKTEMILNMNTNKIPVKTIAECAKLSISEVNKIINSNL